MAVSREIPETLCLYPVQIDTAHLSPEAPKNNGIFGSSCSVNRTAVRSFTRLTHRHVRRSVASGSWWKLPMAGISGGDVIGSCDQIKDLLGRGDIQGPPAVDFAQRDLAAGQQRPEQHASDIRPRQHALGLDAWLEFLVQPLDGVGGPDGLPLVAWEAQEGEEFFARFFQAVGNRAAA